MGCSCLGLVVVLSIRWETGIVIIELTVGFIVVKLMILFIGPLVVVASVSKAGAKLLNGRSSLNNELFDVVSISLIKSLSRKSSSKSDFTSSELELWEFSVLLELLNELNSSKLNVTSFGSSLVVSWMVEDSLSVWSRARIVTGFGLFEASVVLTMIPFVNSLFCVDYKKISPVNL